MSITMLCLLAWCHPLAAEVDGNWFNPEISIDTVLACNDLIQKSLDGNCEALISPDDLLEDYSGPAEDYGIDIADEAGLVVENPVTGAYTGEVLTVTVTHIPSGNSCWGNILIEDHLAPEITCTDFTIPCFQELDSVPFAIAVDNCDLNPTVVLVNLEVEDEDPCESVIIRRTFVAYDNQNNYSAPCLQTLTMELTDLPAFPKDTLWQCDIYSAFPNVINATQLTDSLATTGSGVPDVALGNNCPYTVTHSDLFFSSCGGSFTILRTWTVINWCTGQIILEDVHGGDNLQLIRVRDTLPPVLTMEPLTVSANVRGSNTAGCTAINFLPPATVTDNCHGWSLEIFTPIGEANYINGADGNDGGVIPAPGLPTGIYTLWYVATDICGNKDSLAVPLTVADLIAPVTICDEITNVSLDNNGFAEIEAAVLDDGSYDNCCLNSFLVRRMDAGCTPADTLFGPTVVFCCGDVDSMVTVVMRAVDCAGNFNDCMVLVEVEDKIAPVLVSCPPPAEIDCAFFADSLESQIAAGNFEVLEPYGMPQFSESCQLVYLLDTVIWNPGQCYNGELIRSWKVTDLGANAVLSCSQVLTITHDYNWWVTFPADITVSCTDTLPTAGEPQVFFENCELIATTFSDQVFTVVPDACFEIVRIWTIINWCETGTTFNDDVVESSEQALNYDLNGDGVKSSQTFRDGLNTSNFEEYSWRHGAQPDGVVVHQQVIRVLDDVAPIVICPVQWEVCILDSNCVAIVEMPWPDIHDCSPDISVTAQGELGTGLGPFEDIGSGIYHMTYIVTDNCNNTSTCATTVVVKDCKKPVPYCVNGLSVTLGQDTSVTIIADDFNEGSFDNCSGDLVFSFSPDISFNSLELDCYSLGTVFVGVWVTDGAGNQDYCETFVFVDDNIGICQGPPLIAGMANDEMGNSVSKVEVSLNGAVVKSDTTGAAGTYSFEVVPGGDYTVTPFKDMNPLNGVTTFDLVLISRHILGTGLLGSPYKLIAADVNKSGTITTADLVVIRKLILNMNTEFPGNSSWRFVPKNYVFANPVNPFLEAFPEVRNVNDVSSDLMDVNFVAIKIGDVNASADPTL
ncbi:MAG: hypothetical protein EPO28_01505 [Saprospiraceae bacterium]|nr:MAG: hypothetical protein EPO28_01505 [Saprospiraceae bacterium]